MFFSTSNNISRLVKQCIGMIKAHGTKVITNARRVALETNDKENARYVIKDGLRYVPPYYFRYDTFAKARWHNRGILDVFLTEFRDREAAYYAEVIANGKVTLNGKVVSADTLVRNGDVINHTLHRHEPPVPADQIKIVARDDERGIIVIDKPAGIPVHPAGRYRHNTVLHIMRHEMGINVICSCNRLDRLTSGLMIMAMTANSADEVRKLMMSRGIHKEYIARTVGKFPSGIHRCDEPILTVAPKFGLNRVRASGKEASTIFERIGYDGEYSVVHCKPLTGRTHQIRVHLQHLGHPIANDSLYANPHIWGDSFMAATTETDDVIVKRMEYVGKTIPAQAQAWNAATGAELWSGEKCDACFTNLYTDPNVDELGIWLHAWKYADESGNWAFETPLPSWATDYSENAI